MLESVTRSALLSEFVVKREPGLFLLQLCTVFVQTENSAVG